MRKYYEYRSALMHFLMGALLNLYAIFYFSELVATGVLRVSGLPRHLLLANEVKRVKSMGLAVSSACSA